MFLSGMAVATGDAEAPGLLPQTPPGVDFKIGYFHGLDDATGWGIG